MMFRVASDSKPGLTYNVYFRRHEGPHCSCPAFARSEAYAKRRTGDWIPACKHVTRVMLHACLWNEMSYDGGDRAMSPVPDSLGESPSSHQCPKCGGPCVAVRISV